MTLDEALKLEAGPELDALVAREVMKWRIDWAKDNDKFNPLHWRPSTDGNAMLEVAQKLNAGGWTIGLQWEEDDKRTYASVENDQSVFWGEAGAVEMPLALCRAAIMACWEGKK